MTFGCLHLNQKTNENISVFLPYLSKIGQIKKRMQIVILEDKQSLISMIMSTFKIRHILEARAEVQKYFRLFFGSNKDIQKSF